MSFVNCNWSDLAFYSSENLSWYAKTFSTLPLVAKAVLLGLIYWVVYATASADTQPFIYFQF